MKDLFNHIRPAGWLQAGLSVLLIGLLYHSTLQRLIFKDWTRQDFDYCYLIPLVIVYLLWEVRHEFFARVSRPSPWGMLPVAMGLLLFIFGEFGGEFLIQYLSLFLVVFGLCWTAFGWKRFSVIAIPVSFMVTAFPPPSFIYSRITIHMQLLSSKISAALLRLMGIPVYQKGNVLDLGVEQLQVVDACSGLRSLIPMAIVALLLAYLYKNRWWKRLVILLSAIPLAVVLNGIRIGIIGYLISEVDSSMGEGPIHDLTGWGMFFVGTGVMFGLTLLMTKSETGRQSAPPGNAVNGGVRETNAVKQPDRFLPVPLAAAFLIILAVSGFTHIRGQAGMIIPEAGNFATFPETMGQWSGYRQKMSPRVIERLDLTDYVQITYRKPSTAEIDFYVAWYASQRKGESIHSPETCLLGGGWRFHDKQETKIKIPAYEKSPLRVTRVILKQGEARMLAYFWFPCRERTLVNAYELKLYTFWDNLTKRRTDGALVRVITPVGTGESLDTAENRMARFLGKALPVLDKYLPGK
ncbi:MAG: VPLPA-CTERM-specific exosortase XrtD [Thermodesulfobacteriota bacterium]|nr:VPLPA-CTERM-specific exosortase XrtD [Thermodesulfobacteriota bacterium]